MIKILSGGQTGVDRAALDAALKLGMPCGGWCPDGRLAEDGHIPLVYPLEELPGSGYSGRTLRNVLDSDGTVILHFGPVAGGTRLCATSCRKNDRPLRLIDCENTTPEDAADQIEHFVQQHRLRLLNVAGPRESEAPEAYRFAFRTITQFLLHHEPIPLPVQEDPDEFEDSLVK